MASRTLRDYSIFNELLIKIINSKGFSGCSNNNDDEPNSYSTTLPEGTYIEENGIESELFSIVVKGNNIQWTCTVYGVVDSTINYTYTLEGSVITIYSDKGKETGYYNKTKQSITFGEITYIKK